MYRKTFSLLATMVFPLICVAQQACPIDVTKVNTHTLWGGGSRTPENLEIKYRNVSNREVVATKFGLVLFDAVGDPIGDPPQKDVTTNKKVKPGQDVRELWPEWYYKNYKTIEKNWHKDSADAWLLKVVFADGTNWTDDGTRSCNVGIEGLSPKGKPSVIKKP